MNHALRPYATAGLALVGAGMIAVAPVATPLPDTYVTRDVALTTGIDFTTAWTDAFTTAEANLDALQTASTDAQTALSDAIAANPDWAQTSLQELLGAVTFLSGDQKTFIDPLTAWTLGVQTPDSSIGEPGFTESYAFLFSILTNQAHELEPTLFPALPDYLPPIANFLASPLSGALIGELGPFVSPWVALINSIDAITSDLSGDTPDTTAALQELVNIPANMVNGFLNGATLDLNALVPAVNEAGLLPEGTSIANLSFALGGLLTPGEVGSPTSIDGLTAPAVAGGGSILNSLGLGLSVTSPLTVTFPWIGHGVGPFGALVGLEQVIAEVLSGTLTFGPSDTTAAAVDPGDLLSGLSQAFGDLFGSL